MSNEKEKALIVPLNNNNEIFIQDRRGFKKPDWGFFGGGIEEGETPLDAVIRETKEELDIDVAGQELEFIGAFPTVFDGIPVQRHMFVYRTDRENFNVLEGAGGYWMSLGAAAQCMHVDEKFNQLRKHLS